MLVSAVSELFDDHCEISACVRCSPGGGGGGHVRTGVLFCFFSAEKFFR